jgi:CRISPR-associated endonuclease Csn1
MTSIRSTIAFDIGYASIGWCVLNSQNNNPDPEILGTGVVTFPTDDCLASERRDRRRTRRHIRSTRQRIERLKLWLSSCGALSRADLDKPGHPAPFLLAAAALQGHRKLNNHELWTVLRWYAHNRGYDGNSLWARDESNDDDTEKETNAKSLMAKYGTKTMCETVCACLELNPVDNATRISSALPYKTLNAAYPRQIVRAEVAELLRRQEGIKPETIRMLLKSEALTKEERTNLTTAGIKLPLRYHGGLLFGQLIPRFDNRIISRCPITWAKTYDEAIESGKTEKEARHLAEKFSKVPASKSAEFLEYRFARILANLRVNGEAISPDARLNLFDLAKQQGSLTPTDLKKCLTALYPKAKTNIADYFTLHPDSAKALVLDPVADAVRKASGKTSKLAPIWHLLDGDTQEKIKVRWSKNQGISLAEILQMSGNADALIKELELAYAKANKPKNGKTKFADINQYLLRTSIAPEFPTGRAPYARPVLKQVVAEVLAGSDPTKPAQKTSASEGENKPADGVLYQIQNPRSRANELRAERPIDQLTNNHLVRHRMLILDRLVADLAKEFTIPENPNIIVEVARELKEFSGKTAKKISAELNSKLKDFKATITYLEKHAPDLPLNGSLIRKARIAMDMDWQCPFTGDRYDAYDLTKLEREHIIPYATRNSNALHALVLTWPEVNRMKGKRSALQFINEEGGKRVSNKDNLSILPTKAYESLVDKLKVTGHDDDRRRQKARKALLLTTQLEEKDLGFTDGQLTQTSQLMKLAMRGLKKQFPAAQIDPIPGPVTAEIRKVWRLIGTLSLVCPEILDPEGKPKPKDEIRSLTHMHHALDAATLAFISHYFPLRQHGQDQTGKLWKAMLKRNKSSEEIDLLARTGIYRRAARPRLQPDGSIKEQADAQLRDLSPDIKNALAHSLAQARVMQHIPADRSGAKAELTTWGVVKKEGEGEDARFTLRQNSSVVEDGIRIRTAKERDERAGKLLGPNPKNDKGKLAEIKGAMIIGENYGLALDPTPTVIPFHNVTARLAELRKANGGKHVRVIRNGNLINVVNWPGKNGNWKVMSCKASMKLDLAQPHETKSSWREVAISSLLSRGVIILPQRYTGNPTSGL